MCDDVIVDLKNRDGDLLYFKDKPVLSVADLKQASHTQKVLERDTFERYSDVLNSFGVCRPLPNYCVPALVQPVFDHEIF